MATGKPKMRSSFNRPPRSRVAVGTGSGAKQSMRDECDINKIMAKYQKTGAITHFTRHSPEYGFATSEDFSESMRVVATAQTMFAELPSSIRNRFENEPQQFLAFVQDDANAEEMVELGLAPPKPESPRVDPVGPPEGDPEPSAEPSESPPPTG